MPRLACLAAAALMLAVQHPAVADAPAAPTLVVAYVDGAAPTLDGRLDEPLWASVPEVELRGSGPGALTLRLRTVRVGDGLYLAVRWPDRDPPALESSVPAFSTLTATLGTQPAHTWNVTLDGTEPKSGAEAAGRTADGWCGVELVRAPMTSMAGRSTFPPADPCHDLTVAVRTRDGGAADVRVTLRPGAAPRVWGFEGDAVGGDAAGLRAALGGKGAPPSWVVKQAGSSRVLVQQSQDQTDARFPLALAEGVVARDVDLSVRFQCMDGWKDRAAGIVWRAKDERNHYILRANALERNVVLYKMQDGLRVDLPPVGRESEYGVKAELDPAAWHTLRIVAVGARFEAWLDGRYLFHVVDATFSDPGTVGLWTKSDSVTAFDDLTLVQLDAPAAAR